MATRAASTRLARLLSTATARQTPNLPTLTLYTGGPECSLCEVAKADLAQVNQAAPFYLEMWNIRDPPSSASKEEAKKWKRMYQYDIPVLHMGERMLQKHRINKDKLISTIQAWHAGQEKAGHEAKP